MKWKRTGSAERLVRFWERDVMSFSVIAWFVKER